eukprot:CAMPEP_0198209398 /NCGR_PEP_ID=MMETSP1445-20131203/15447_1 /TAXON_ID=36898 /ORGANISM="Pyramimonas sp., Strain CCMP2087" /LENGTH=118 /DNA_ID=CAMNT_0043883165 /DNA_START=328 /DNA_END=684 /DNA_ORIENTATION=-
MDTLSKATGREMKTKNLVMGLDDGDGAWERIDAKVNEYPCQRKFQAIGPGGDDFVKSMVETVARALNVIITPEMIILRPSSKGKYISVNIGPVTVRSGDEVQAVYTEMKKDSRVKYLI